MARRLINIKNLITDSENSFYEYLLRTEDKEVMNSINRLSKSTKVFIFSGVIRNFFLGEKNNRDIDIVLEKEIDVSEFFDKDAIKRNSFGGFKIKCNSTTIDMWYLKNTWAFKNEPINTFDFDFEHKVPGTAFFNFSSIVYSLNEKKFIWTEEFERFLQEEEIDVVYKKNPNYKLCVVNTFYYSEKYRLNIKDDLKKYLIDLYHNDDHRYEDVQIKHFGKVIFSDKQIQHRIETIFHPRIKFKKRKIVYRWNIENNNGGE